MNKLLIAFASSLFVFAGSAHASPCESKAVSKDGKPLSGAAKSSFIAKCEKDLQAACETKAVSKEGKPLSGAAKDSSVKKCMGSAK